MSDRLLPLTMIVAIADDGTIGDKGGIPWTIPADMARFRKATVGRAVIMGRRTWESLPDVVRPLPKRRNIVVSRSMPFAFGGMPGAEVWRDLDHAIDAARASDPEPIIIGGAEIYKAALPKVTRILLTRVHCSPGGDTRFHLNMENTVGFSEVSCEHQAPGPGFNWSFFELVRVH